MARTDTVWGIDIGNCSLKALRCRVSDDPNRVVAEAFDYIEYPKILTQPDASPAELINEALKQFLARNEVRRSRVAISVSGQAGLARFIKLPPVEAKKISAIVQYEARQQIPFDLSDVIWDYQRMGGGMEEEGGFVLETEIGLFAMKRDQVLRALEPFERAGIPVDIIQLTPLSLFNFAVFDQIHDLPSADDYDPDSPPPSTVLLSIGTDASDLVVTNGFRVWQRSISLGGSHFTKALTKELKLTFAKAEHLKRNAGTAQDPKAVFQAMRPVFNDLLTEIQRSIGFFSSINRAAKIEKMLALGNTVKLPGLRRYLAQNLGFEVDRLETFSSLDGSEVTGAPAFQENLACFGVCYGLCLQGLKKGSLHTNMLPKEIAKDRVIRAKKPWALAGAAVLLLGCTISLASHAFALKTVDQELFGPAEKQAESVKRDADNFKSEADKVKGQFDDTKKIGANVVDSIEGRVRWLRLLKAIGECLPSDGKQVPEDIEQRNELHIRSMDCQQIDGDKEKLWLKSMIEQGWYEATPEEKALAGVAADAATSGGAAPSGTAASAAATSAPAATPAAAPATPATGTAAPAAGTESGKSEENPGGIWLVRLTGYHYHNARNEKKNFGAEYIRNTLIRNLREMQIDLPEDVSQKPDTINIRDLAIRYPVLVGPETIQEEYLRLESDMERTGAPGEGMLPPGPRTTGRPPMGGMMPPGGSPGMGGMGAMGPRKMAGGMGATPGGDGQVDENAITLRRLDFSVEFIWQPMPPGQKKTVAPQGQNAAQGQNVPQTSAQPGPAGPGPASPQPGPAPTGPTGPVAPGPAAPGPAPGPAAPGPAAPGPAAVRPSAP